MQLLYPRAVQLAQVSIGFVISPTNRAIVLRTNAPLRRTGSKALDSHSFAASKAVIVVGLIVNPAHRRNKGSAIARILLSALAHLSEADSNAIQNARVLVGFSIGSADRLRILRTPATLSFVLNLNFGAARDALAFISYSVGSANRLKIERTVADLALSLRNHGNAFAVCFAGVGIGLVVFAANGLVNIRTNAFFWTR